MHPDAIGGQSLGEGLGDDALPQQVEPSGGVFAGAKTGYHHLPHFLGVEHYGGTTNEGVA